MEEEKKPKRPRIGGVAPTPAAEGSDGHYEKVNYGEQNSFNPAQRQPRPYGQQQRPYQPRPYGQQGYQQRPYQPRPYGQQGYQQRPAAEGEQGQEQQGYQPRQQRPYQPRPYGQQGYQQRQPRPYGQQQRPYGQQQQNYRPRYNKYQQGGEEGSEQREGQEQQGYQQRQPRPYGQQQRPYGQQGYQQRQQRPYGQQPYGQRQQRPYGQKNQYGRPGKFQQPRPGKQFTPRPKQIDYVLEDIDPNEPIRLNKYMANAGVCSRREADEHITAGLVKVNGEVVTELGTKITRNDVVEFEDKVVTPERKCYVLLNKPKDCVTTSDDPNGRTTVLDLVKNACTERIYPVGRLDRNTTGVLLLTNDGDLASKLTHPSYVKKKIYHVWTDKDIAEDDMQRIADGIELEDGEIHADAISYVTDTDRNQAGIEIHSGRNRIVRRIFEHLGYRVTKLDRVYFAGLTKKNLPRGRWRYLTQEEVDYLRKGTFE